MEFEIFTHPQLIYMAWTCLKRQRTQEREREGGRKIEREGLIYRRAGTVYDSVTRVLWVCPSIPLNGPIYFTYRPKYSNSWQLCLMFFALAFSRCLSNATHGDNINLPVCVCLSVCLCVRHTFCQLAYSSNSSTDFYS